MILCDLGAEVVKCERPPYGDVARTTGPLLDGESGYFFSVNRGKRSIAIDLKQEEGRELFLQLAPQFDVLVENFRPGTLERLGLGYERLAEVHPGLIYAAISGYGQTGPLRDRPALDVVIQGAGGVMSVTGEPDGPPLKPGLSLADIAGGLFAAVGILAALRERETSGRGQLVDISMLDCQLAIQENALLRYHLTGDLPQPLGTRHSWAVPFQAFPTADGYIVVALAWGVPNQWALLCSELGRRRADRRPAIRRGARALGEPRRAGAAAQRGIPPAQHGRVGRAPDALRDSLRATQQHRGSRRAAAGRGARDADAGGAPHAGHAAAGEHADQALAHTGRRAGHLAGTWAMTRGRSSRRCWASAVTSSTRSWSARWCGTSGRRRTSDRSRVVSSPLRVLGVIRARVRQTATGSRAEVLSLGFLGSLLAGAADEALASILVATGLGSLALLAWLADWRTVLIVGGVAVAFGAWSFFDAVDDWGGDPELGSLRGWLRFLAGGVGALAVQAVAVALWILFGPIAALAITGAGAAVRLWFIRRQRRRA